MSAEGGQVPGAGWIDLRSWQRAAIPALVDALRAGRRPVVTAFMGSGKSVLIAEMCRLARRSPGRSVIVAAPRANLVEQLAATISRALPGEVGRWYEAAKEGDRYVVVTTYQSLPTLLAAWGSDRSPSLLVCDEAHGTEAEVIRAAIEGIEQAAGRRVTRFGVTATPFRSSARETLSLWDGAAYEYGWRQGIEDGVIVPWRVVRWDGMGRDALEVDAICLDMLRREQVWPTLASARSIEGAERFAAYLSAEGIPAAAVHSSISARERARRIEALRVGELKVLVHVAMLAEGADFPWLKGLMLRRKVAARVRFVQEVGRVLRAHPGKAEGVVFDPYDLMGELGMTHDASIGEVLEQEEGTGGGPGGGGPGGEHPAVSVVPLRVWLADVLSALEGYGATRGAGGRWRNDPATAAQMERIGKVGWAWRWWRGEPRARARIKGWIAQGRAPSKGEAADLISLLSWLADWSKNFRDAVSRGCDIQQVQREYTAAWPEGLPGGVPTIEEV